MLRLSDIATIRRGFSDPPQPMFRVNGKDAIGLAVAMRDGGDILALGRNIQTAMAEIRRDLKDGPGASIERLLTGSSRIGGVPGWITRTGLPKRSTIATWKSTTRSFSMRLMSAR